MTLKELAKELNMSTTTVSRVLNGQEKKYRISERTASKVREAAQQNNFSPNLIAQQLRLQRTNTIGLIIPDISNPFFANLARTVEEELRKRGKMVLLCDTKNDRVLEEESIDLLLGRQVDGILIAPVGDQWSHLQKDPKIPIVLVDRYFEKSTLPYTATDNFMGAYEATAFLLSKGHRQISCIQGLPETSANEERLMGFKKALDEFEIPTSQQTIIGSGYTVRNGYQSAKKLLKNTKPPTAIFALSNLIAMGAMKAIHEAGMKIPEEISLLSFDDQPYFELLSPPLTAVRQPMENMGQAAVEILFDLMNNKPTQSRKLRPTLVDRASVKKISSS